MEVLRHCHTRARWGVMALLFCAVNTSGYEFVGHSWGPRFEAASLFFWITLAWIALLYRWRSAEPVPSDAGA